MSARLALSDFPRSLSSVTFLTSSHLLACAKVDGEPFLQEPSHIIVKHKDQATMLRRVGGSPTLKVVSAVSEVLDQAVDRGCISAAQRTELARDMAARIEGM